jgi:hypothetical protein
MLSFSGCIYRLWVRILQFLCFSLRKSAMFLRYSCFFALGMISTHLSLLDLLWKLSILFEFHALPRISILILSKLTKYMLMSWNDGYLWWIDGNYYLEVYFNKDVVIFYVYAAAEKLNKFISYFVDCICVWLIFCCWHWQIPALLMLLMISCGMLICQWAYLKVDQRSLGTFNLQKSIKNTSKKTWEADTKSMKNDTFASNSFKFLNIITLTTLTSHKNTQTPISHTIIKVRSPASGPGDGRSTCVHLRTRAS